MCAGRLDREGRAEGFGGPGCDSGRPPGDRSLVRRAVLKQFERCRRLRGKPGTYLELLRKEGKVLELNYSVEGKGEADRRIGIPAPMAVRPRPACRVVPWAAGPRSRRVAGQRQTSRSAVGKRWSKSGGLERPDQQARTTAAAPRPARPDPGTRASSAASPARGHGGAARTAAAPPPALRRDDKLGKSAPLPARPSRRLAAARSIDGSPARHGLRHRPLSPRSSGALARCKGGGGGGVSPAVERRPGWT